MPRKKFVVCLQCRRVLNRKHLIKEGDQYKCPYCGGTKFAETFSNIVMIIDPEKSYLAKQLEKHEKGIFALTVEL